MKNSQMKLRFSKAKKYQFKEIKAFYIRGGSKQQLPLAQQW